MKAYFDDTGDSPLRFVGFGGIVAKECVWDDSYSQWAIKNQKHGISQFHAKIYSELIPEYVALSLEHELYLVGCTVDLAAYREYATRKKRNPFGANEYASAAEGAMVLLLDFLRRRDEECGVFLDCKEGYSSSVQEILDDLMKWRRNSHQLLSITIPNPANKSKFPFFQIADLAANVLSKHVCRTHYQEDREDFVPRFQAHKGARTIHFDMESIEKLAGIYTAPAIDNDF